MTTKQGAKEAAHTPGLRCWTRPSDATPYECPEHFALYRAAPDLLDTMTLIAACLRTSDGKMSAHMTQELYSKARAVIEKATGKSQGGK